MATTKFSKPQTTEIDELNNKITKITHTGSTNQYGNLQITDSVPSGYTPVAAWSSIPQTYAVPGGWSSNVTGYGVAIRKITDDSIFASALVTVTVLCIKNG